MARKSTPKLSTEKPKIERPFYLAQAIVENVRAARRIIFVGAPIVRLVGGNGSGKSSGIDGIELACRGIKQMRKEVPPSSGSSNSEVIIDYVYDLLTREPTLRVQKDVIRNKLTITWPDGGVSNKQEDLDALFSAACFSPLSIATRFEGESAEHFRDRVRENLESLLEPETFAQLKAAKEKVQNLAEAQTQANAAVGGFGKIPILMPVQKMDVADIQKEADEADAHNTTQTNRQTAIDAATKAVEYASTEVGRLEKQLEEARAKLRLANVKLEELPKPEPVKDTSALRQKLADASMVNVQAEQYRQNEEKRTKFTLASQAAMKAKDDLDAAREAVKTIIRNATLPLPGLEWSPDGEISVNGIPWDQESQGKRLFNAIQLTMGIVERDNNPSRTIWIREAAHLDEKNIRLIADAVVARGFQAIMETHVVPTEKGNYTIIQIENGYSKGSAGGDSEAPDEGQKTEVKTETTEEGSECLADKEPVQLDLEAMGFLNEN